ncbi:MAG: fused MFS/spermidine synthase, partial [Alphaproteobacteria bacterium]|nr:fused MFS/spermidine synthase [Alphaproteobacteria bacterium]
TQGLSQTVSSTTSPDHKSGPGTLWLFTLTTLLSALLLFSIQPMFAKMVLPVLGGSPSVWAIALAFFQGTLLAGYCYAHALMRYLPAKKTGFVHLAFCAVAFLALPIALPEGWQEPPVGDAYLWQIGLFAVAIGLPFMAVAANAPLLQAWFSRAGHAQSNDPYFLYAASNLGSFFALLGYPLLLEPIFGVSTLSGFWLIGYVCLIGAIATCFAVVWKRQADNGAAPVAKIKSKISDVLPNWSNRLTWIGLAMVPSALLTAFTTHVATDVASAPLLWVIPLSLYLLTFVIVFRDSGDEGQEPLSEVISWLHVITVFLVFVLLSQKWYGGWFISSSLGFSAFVAATLVAHRTLYEARPSANSLTEFYLWMSFGGVLGGLFSAIVAPKIFSELYEYPLILALTLACRPGVIALIKKGGYDYAGLMVQMTAGLAAITGFTGLCLYFGWTFWEWGPALVLIIALGFVLFYFWKQPMQQLAVMLLMVVVLVFLPTAVHVGEAQRSFFGVYRVIQSDDGQFNVLQHGSTLHGAQRMRDEKGNPVTDLTPATYYYSGGPIHQAVAAVQRRLSTSSDKGRFGIVGLGAGALACHSQKGETWRFYEIDPVVVQIAQSPDFSYLAKCQPNADIVIGDARLTVGKEKDESFDLLVIDAFSSDAVPMHLLTREALSLYLSKLKPDGVGLLHISNRHLDLEGVLHATFQGIDGVSTFVFETMQDPVGYKKTSSQVAVFSKDPHVAHSFLRIRGARTPRYADVQPWTDDASDVLGPFLSKLRRQF